MYSTPRGDRKIYVHLQGETTWMTQEAMAHLFGVKAPIIAEHLKDACASGDLTHSTTCSSAGMDPQAQGRQVESYNLDAIIAVGLRVNSPQAVQFRLWATETLGVFLTKGFVLDKERLKQGGNDLGQDYFNDLLERIQEIRISLRSFYQRLTDIYALSLDYRKDAPTTKDFYAAVMNKLSWAIRSEVSYFLSKEKVQALNLLVSAYLDLAESRARMMIPTRMDDWARILDGFLEVAKDPEKLNQELAETLASRILPVCEHHG